MTDPATIPPPPPKPEGPGLIEDLVDIFASPARVFARRATSGGGLAFVVVAVLLAVVIYASKGVMEPIMEAQMSKAMAAAQASNPNLTSEQLQAGMAFQRKLFPVFLVAGAPIAILGLGLIVWVAGKGFGAAVTFGSSVMIASFAYVPRVIGGVATLAQGVLMKDVGTLTNPAQLSLSPARFFDPATTGGVLLALLTRFDIITIWVTVLIGVGLMAAGKLPKGKAAAAAITVWVLGAIFPVWGAIRGG
ncbi:MAG: YIP1 family protein [Gemmatimonadota bacterium]|nr:YIP1 family protein [Gemmatimonadota bacterium]